MTSIRKRWLSRTTIGLGAAMALIVAAAGPAAADLPSGIDVDGDAVGDQIRVNDVFFEVGGDPDPDDDCTTGAGSTIEATVSQIVGGVADVTVTALEFDSAEIQQTIFGPVCATIVLQNLPLGGTQISDPLDPERGVVTIDDPAPLLDVEIDGPFFPANCRLDNIDLSTATGTADDPLDGEISHAGAGNPWNLTQEQGNADTPGSGGGPTVPDPTDCGSFADDIEDAFGTPGDPNNLPTEDVGARLEFVIS